MKLYEITIWDFTDIREAETAGRAKWLYYLKFSDAWPMTFGEFLKQCKCKCLGQKGASHETKIKGAEIEFDRGLSV